MLRENRLFDELNDVMESPTKERVVRLFFSVKKIGGLEGRAEFDASFEELVRNNIVENRGIQRDGTKMIPINDQTEFYYVSHARKILLAWATGDPFNVDVDVLKNKQKLQNGTLSKMNKRAILSGAAEKRAPEPIREVIDEFISRFALCVACALMIQDKLELRKDIQALMQAEEEEPDLESLDLDTVRAHSGSSILKSGK